MKDNIIKKAYIAAFEVENKSLKELMTINTKCMVDNSTQRYVYIDNNRLKDELIYYNFYGEKPQYNSILNTLLPIILSNTNIQKSEDETVELIKKYVRYLKKEQYLFDYILAAVMYNCVIHSLIENKNLEYEELLQNIKEKIIGFTIDLDKMNTIKFQMARINFIQQIDKYMDLKVEGYDDNKIINSTLNVLYDIYIEDRNEDNDGIKSMKKSILSILGEEIDTAIDNIDFITSMSEYIVKMRKYMIHKKLYTQSADPRTLIGLNEGETKVDPILNQITVVSKNFSNNILSLKLKSKSGIYILKFKKS